MRKRFAAAALIIALTFAGCSASTPHSKHTPTNTSGEPVGVGVTVGEATVKLDENGKRYWYLPEKTPEQKQQELLERHQLVGVLNVPRMDEVPFIEYADTNGNNRYQCISDFGFTYAHDEKSGWSISVPPEQRDAFHLAEYKCELMYPDDPSTIHPPMNEDQVSYYYDWQTGPARKCYEEHGYPVKDPPSKQVFIDDWFDNMNFDTWFLGDYAPLEDTTFTNKTCPWYPPDTWEH